MLGVAGDDAGSLSTPHLLSVSGMGNILCILNRTISEYKEFIYIYKYTGKVESGIG